jgi:serine protease Do
MKLSRSDIPVSIENMGMAIPSRTVKSVVEELVQNGKVVHAVLGITCQEMDQTRAHMVQVPEGLWITTINSASDVAKHDIQVGDLITAVNGQPVNTVLQFRDATSGKAPGDKVKLTLWRDEALLEELERLKAEASSSAEESASASREPYEYHFEELGDVEVKLVDSDTLAED